MTVPLSLSHFSLYIILLICVTSLPLYSSDYLLLPGNTHVMIPINNSLLLKSNNGSMQYLKVTVKIQIRAANGTYIDSPYESGNIMVKYWKNQENTLAQDVLSYSYETISRSRKILTSTDSSDRGLFDIEALHNYESEHNFMHSYGNESSDVLFVLAVYRFSGNNITDLLGMTKMSDEVKISVSIFKASAVELKCSFCSVKTFCPVNQCECYQEIYSDCQVKRKMIVAKTDPNSITSDSISLQMGTLSFVQIEPDNTTKQSYLAKILLKFDATDPLMSSAIRADRIFFLLFSQSKADPSYMIPNIYNFNSLNSPSFTSKITSSSLRQQSAISAYVGVGSDNGIFLYQQSNINKNEILTMAIYYLNDTGLSALIQPQLVNPNNNTVDLTVNMEMSFGAQIQDLVQGSMNIGLIIGMIALGFFLLIMLICVLHFIVARKFSFFSIFSTSQSSNRTSMLSARHRSRKITNMSQQATSLPQISYEFMKQLIFRPLKFIYTPKLQRKSMLKPKNTSSSTDQLCSICLQEFSSQTLVKYTYCGHILDSKCIGEWFKKEESCPLCRQKLQSDDISEYESRIMEEVWENEYYQTVLDEEVNVLKRIYKEWEDGKIIKSKREELQQQKESLKYTEESLVDNNFTSSKYIQNAIHNISTMQQLQRSLEPIISSKLQQQSITNQKNQTENPQFPIIQTIATNQSHFHQPLPQSITLQSLPWLIPVLQASTSVSFKRFIKIYRFYRCIYLYHQINKKFQKDSNLCEPSISLQEKQIKAGDLKELQIQHQLNEQSNMNQQALYMTSRKCMVRQQEQDGGDRYYFNENHQNNQSHELQTNFNSQHKLKSTLSFKKIKNNKHGRAAFHLDFQFNQQQLPQITNKNNKNNTLQRQQQPTIQTPPINNFPTLIMQENQQPVLFRQPTDSSQQSHHIKLVQRGKCVSMREEMDGLEREFAQRHDRKISDELNEDVRFRDQRLFYEQEDEEIENQRYIDERYIDVLSPVVLSPRKMSVKREKTNRSNLREPTNRSNIRNPTNRSNQTQSMHVSRGTFQSRASEESKANEGKNSSNSGEESKNSSQNGEPGKNSSLSGESSNQHQQSPQSSSNNS